VTSHQYGSALTEVRQEEEEEEEEEEEPFRNLLSKS